MRSSIRTRVFRVNPEEIDMDAVRASARILRNGGLVAFPTETVYGLGASAYDPEAVQRIFEVKGRASDNPLIFHIARREDVWSLARSVPEVARDLIDRFWPGPLTLVLSAREGLCSRARAGLGTLAVRMPDHTVALALISSASVPVVAPSANLSGRPSPTRAEHVMDDLGGRIDAVIDAGDAGIGVESTVVDVTEIPYRVLRPGGVTLEELQEALPGVDIAASQDGTGEERPRSPGLKYLHYSPRAHVILVDGPEEAVRSEIQRIVHELEAQGERVGTLSVDEHLTGQPGEVVRSLGSRRDLTVVASRLYRVLREMDGTGVDTIVVEGVPPVGLGFAVMNRLRRAATRVVEVGREGEVP